MLRSFFLTALMAPAVASEDLSLMQQSSVTMAKASAQEVQMAFHALGDKLRELPNTGKVRQMAIDALMREVSEKTEIDDAAKGLLTQVLTLLNQILGTMQGDKTSDQSALDLIKTDVPGCSRADDVTEDANKKTASDNAWTEHQTCRSDEQSLFEAKVTSCLKLSNHLNGIKETQTVCVTPAGLTKSHDYANQWETQFFNPAKVDSSQDYETYLELEPNCTADIGALAEKRDDCNADQKTYETKYCLWRLERITRCSYIDTCYDTKTTTHTNLIEGVAPTFMGIKATSNQRVREARVIKHVICLVTALKAGTTDPTDCETEANTDAFEDHIQENYNVSYPPIPAKPACDTSETNTCYPGLDDHDDDNDDDHCWKDTAYANFDTEYPGALVVDPSGVECLNTGIGHNQE